MTVSLTRSGAARLIVCSVLFAAGRGPIAGENDEDPRLVSDQARLLTFVVDGFRAERERLLRGVCRAHGFLDRSEESEFPLTGPVEYLIAFDSEHGWVRYDADEPIWKLPAEGDSAAAQLGRKRVRFTMRDGKYSVWQEGLERIFVSSLTPQSSEGTGYFDVRFVGLFNFDGIRHAGATFDEVMSRVGNPPDKVLETDTGQYLLTHRERGNTRLEVWLDASRGFSPKEVELIESDPPAELPSVLSRGTISWTNIADVWVPSGLTHETFYGAKERIDLVFEWESVNEPLSDELFSLEGLNVAGQTAVIDSSLGTPIRHNSLRELQHLRDESRRHPPTAAVPGAGWVRWLALLNIAILIAIVVVLVARRRAR